MIVGHHLQKCIFLISCILYFYSILVSSLRTCVRFVIFHHVLLRLAQALCFSLFIKVRMGEIFISKKLYLYNSKKLFYVGIRSAI